MFIHHFNRLIRNKWVWGAFAIFISAAFALDFLASDRYSGSSQRGDSAGKLGGADFDGALFNEIASDIRGRGRDRDSETPEYKVNRAAWETAAAIVAAKELGLEAVPAEVRESIADDRYFRGPSGAFDFGIYKRMLAENGLSPEAYEASLARMITQRKLMAGIALSADWVSPMELERALADYTDVFDVRTVTFVDKAKDPVLDDAALEKYYNAHTNSLALPDLVSVRYVKFTADDEKAYSKMAVSEDEIKDYYDVVGSRFETETTNGVVRKSFEEVRPVLLAELQRIALLECYATNLPFRVYGDGTATNLAAVSKLDEIAAAEKLPVSVSPRFGAEGSRIVNRALMSSPRFFAPDTEGFAAAAFELDPEAEELRYGIIRGTNAVYLIERASFVKAHVPGFNEAKEAIRAEAVQDAKQTAFQAEVEKIIEPARKALAEGKAFDENAFAGASVSSNFVFSAADSGTGIPDYGRVVPAAMKLRKGELSDFTAAGRGRAIVVYMADRKPGAAASAEILRPQLRDELGAVAGRGVMADWRKWNLERLGCQPAASASMDAPDENYFQED